MTLRIIGGIAIPLSWLSAAQSPVPGKGAEKHDLRAGGLLDNTAGSQGCSRSLRYGGAYLDMATEPGTMTRIATPRPTGARRKIPPHPIAPFAAAHGATMPASPAPHIAGAVVLDNPLQTSGFAR